MYQPANNVVASAPVSLSPAAASVSAKKGSVLRRLALASAIIAAVSTGCGLPEQEGADTEELQDNLTSPTMWIGARVSEPDATQASFNSASSKFGPLRVRRSFNSHLPVDIQHTEAADDVKNHVVTFLSVRTPQISSGVARDGYDPVGVARGDYDKQITTLAASFPTDHTTYLTMFHEAEAWMTGPQFVAMFRHFYTKVKAANSHIKVGTVHMSYQWRPGSTTTKDQDSWWVGSAYTDFIGVDDYNTATTTGRTNAGNDPQFQRWFNWAKTKGKPLAVVEFGRLENPKDASARANELLNTETWMRNNNFFMFLYWHGYDEPNQGGVNWGITGTASQNAMRAISSRGKTGW